MLFSPIKCPTRVHLAWSDRQSRGALLATAAGQCSTAQSDGLGSDRLSGGMAADSQVVAVLGSTPEVGRKTVNVEPWPGVLSTVMSPPISRQKCRLIARPRPVPPYRRVVEASAWVKGWKSLRICSGVMPMPESDTRKASQAAGCMERSALSANAACSTLHLVYDGRVTARVMVPCSVNFAALESRLKRTWRTLVRSACKVPISGEQEISR